MCNKTTHAIVFYVNIVRRTESKTVANTGPVSHYGIICSALIIEFSIVPVSNLLN